jgi:tetratricopeptide (TPR) repeat protein
VAGQVTAYLAGVQERLRAAEVERAAAQAREEEARATAAAQRRARWRMVGLVAALLLLVLLGGGAGLWLATQRENQLSTVNRDLKEVVDSLRIWKVTGAEAAMERAEGGVANGAPADLLRRVRRMRDDLTLARRLDRIRLNAAAVAGAHLDYPSADRDYATAFQEQGLAAAGEDAGVVAARVRDSALREQLVAALDDWATAAEDDDRRKWLLAVARQAQPGAWGDRFRDPEVWEQMAALEQLAREADVTALSPQSLTALAWALLRKGADPGPLLRKAQARHPTDFWLNFELGTALGPAHAEEAIGYFRAALAVRPDTSAVYNNFGNALRAAGRADEAIEAYQRALDLDPQYAKAHSNLGTALFDKGRLKEAIEAFRAALDLNPELALAHDNFGVVRRIEGAVDEAIAEHRKAIDLDRKYAPAHANLGLALQANNRLDEAVKEFRESIRLDPRFANAHGALGAALLRQGRFAEACEANRHCLELLPDKHPLRQRATRQLRECEQLLALDKELSAVLEGNAQPAGARQRLDLASLCQTYKHRYAASAHLYAGAFADQPRLADDLGAGHRYNAACAVALAAAGQGEDAKLLPDKVTQALRRQALAWLRADLTAWAAQPDRAAVRRTMHHWQKDADLAGVRDPEGLAQLPEAERRQWRQLWDDVAALLARAAAAP